MLGLYVTVPVAYFRKGLAREYLETEPLPATCYGFLLALVGETDRRRHVGCRVAPILLNKPPTSVVLRTVWRVKKTPLGSSGNTRPDYQQLLTDVQLVIWLDSSGEAGEGLEGRVTAALVNPASVKRFGGLSLGESTHLVDDVCPTDRVRGRLPASGRAFLTAPKGRLTLPVWVDHVGSAGTRYATGDLVESTSLELASDALGLVGKVDCLKRRDGTFLPYEHKRGRPARSAGEVAEAWPSDRLQVVAYAVLLEEAFGQAIPEGRVRYHAANVTVRVPIDDAARADLLEAIAEARRLREAVERPPVADNPRLCGSCSRPSACRRKCGMTASRSATWCGCSPPTATAPPCTSSPTARRWV